MAPNEPPRHTGVDGDGNHEQPVVVSSRLIVPPFEAWLAVAAVYAGVAHFIPALASSGSGRVVAAAFPRLAPLWSVLYAAGGLAILIGLMRRSPRIEGLGINLLASGLTVTALAGIAAGGKVLPIVVVQGGALVACVVRLAALRRLP